MRARSRSIFQNCAVLFLHSTCVISFREDQYVIIVLYCNYKTRQVNDFVVSMYKFDSLACNVLINGV